MKTSDDYKGIGNDLNRGDHGPAAGPNFQKHDVFCEWLAKHHHTTLGLQLQAAVPTGSNELLLGGVLGFLSHRETQSVLANWSETGGANPMIHSLEQLSTSLSMDFPDLGVPPPSQPIALLFHRQNIFPRFYLSACLCTRRPPHQTENVKEGFASLKLWLTLKACEWAQAGRVHDQSIRTVSNHLRMALDGSHPTKFQQLLAVARPFRSASRFEQHLKVCLLEMRSVSASWATDMARAMEKLIDGERTPIPEFQDIKETVWPESSQIPTGAGPWSQGAASEVPAPAPEDAEDLAGVDESLDNPIQRLRLATSVALQTMEDRQYLPLSWNRLRPDEQISLAKKLQEWSSSADQQLRLLAAMVHLAVLTRSTLVTVQGLRLSEELRETWGLNLQSGDMHRAAPRRTVRWKVDAESENWVKPLAGEWRIRLSSNVIAPLREALQQVTYPKYLGELWRNTDQSSPAQTFNQFCKRSRGLERVTSGLLSTLAEQRIFDASGDAVFSRLVTAPPGAGISGAGAYPSWSMQHANTALDAINMDLTLEVPMPDENGMGSELDPYDKMLSDAFAKTGRRLESIFESGSWIHAHNLITGYTLALLLAATGARPARSMFESLEHFDLERGRLFLDDKANVRGVNGLSGRIVPLPEAICTWMKCSYLPHLNRVAHHIQAAIPDLGREMFNQANGSGSEKLPLFVFLREVQGFDWQEVSESSLIALQAFNWPLPWNLFRHRLATRARSLRLDSELVDAQLGHAEGGADTFGDFSPRCWVDDEPAWRGIIEQSFELLCIQFPTLPELTFTALHPDKEYAPFIEGRPFGAQARQAARTIQHSQAKQAAKKDIEAYLASKGKAAHQLNPQEWTELGHRMLFREGNLPHSNSTLRVEVYEQLATRAWREHGTRAHISITARQLPPGRGGFRPDSLWAEQSIQQMKATLERQFTQAVPSKLGKVEAAWMGMLDLALYGRVADRDVLHAVLHPWQEDRVELLVKDGRSFVDIGASTREIGGRSPIRRFPIPARSIQLITMAKTLGRQPEQITIPTWLINTLSCIAGRHFNELQSVLEWITAQVDAANRICLPGLLVGMLSGRVNTYSLWAEDWTRLVKGMAVIHPLHPPEKEHDPVQLEHLRGAPSPRSLTAEERNQKNRQFISVLRRQLDSAKDAKGGSGSRDGLSDRRRKVLGAIKQILNSAPAGISSSILALGEWVAYLLERPRHKSGVLTYSTISRYLGALSSGFLDFGESIDLASLDEDELEDFYLLVIDPALAITEDDTNKDGDSDEHENAQGQSETQEQKVKANQRYVLMRLKEFHSFAVPRFGLPAIDWSQLDQGLTGVIGRPGMITWEEYLDALRMVCDNPLECKLQFLRTAFVLLLSYRFGLRGIEAISLSRSDWVEPTRGAVVVLVRGTLRKLKTRASLRQVPLISELTELEQQIVKTWFEHWQANTTKTHRLPLFFHDSDPGRVADIGPIRTHLNKVLKLVTGRIDTTLHHARHAFANLLATCLIKDLNPVALTRLQPEKIDIKSVQKLVLGTDSLTRRTMWGIARSLGHSQISTTLGSYIHILNEWHEHRVVQDSTTAKLFYIHHERPIDSKIDLSNWRQIDKSDKECLKPNVPDLIETCTPGVEVKYLWYRSRQVTPTSATREVSINTDTSKKIEEKLSQFSLTLFTEAAKLNKELHPGLLLSKITTPEWEQIKSICNSINRVPPKNTWALHLTRNRQVLLWRSIHIAKFEILLNFFSLDWDDFLVYSSARQNSVIAQEIKNRDIPIESTRRQDHEKPDTSIKRFQIDTAWETDQDGAKINFKDRIAITPSPKLRISSYGLALMLLICS